MPPEFVVLSCPACGGKLHVTEDIERFACGSCGSEMIVNRGGGIISLIPVTEGLRRIQSGTDKTASELAIVRLGKEIGQLEAKLDEMRDERSRAAQQAAKFGVIGVVFALFVFSASNGEAGRIACGSVALAGAFIAFLIAIVQWTSKGYKERSDDLRRQIGRKHAERRRHQEIVSRL